MTAILLRLLVYVLIFGAIYFGLRRIWRDWTGQFRSVDKARHQRDLNERARPGVIELKRDADGVYRPPTGADRS
jgi:hypothetical protein